MLVIPSAFNWQGRYKILILFSMQEISIFNDNNVSPDQMPHHVASKGVRCLTRPLSLDASYTPNIYAKGYIVIPPAFMLKGI